VKGINLQKGDAPVATDNDGQATLVEEPKAKATKLTLASDHERKVTRESFEHRADELDKLAKKNEDEGYVKLGRIVKGDSALLRHELLPQVKDVQMRLADGAGLLSGLIRLVEPRIRQDLPVKVDAAKWKREDQAAVIAKALADILEDYITHVAETAWTAGFNARDTEPEQVAFRCLETYREPASK
jgi:hypothetical protein